MKITKLFVFTAIILSLACGDSSFPGYDKTENGLYYSITEAGESDRKVMLDDIVTLDLMYMTDDTVLYDSKIVPYPTQLKISTPAYQGDVMEGLAMMNIGDEASFKTSADSFFTAIAKVDRPEFIDSGAFLTFEIKVLNTQTLAELTAEKDAKSTVSRENEIGLIASYLDENSITQEPTESGLYFIETAPGSGEVVERGSLIKVHYIGRLLTGEKFDSSHDRGEPIEFTLGMGQVIPGWDEGIGYMTVGSKATLIIPSSLAYGENPPPGSAIKPFSPLVFDVELVEIN